MKENVLGSIRLFLALTVLLGLAYPAVVWAIGRVAFRDAADGSLLKKKDDPGTLVGSSLIGQSFVMPGHFHGRPSAAGNGYDPTAIGGTNLGPTSKKLADSVKDAVTAVRSDEGVTGSVPADAVTSSGSGLDPHISPGVRAPADSPRLPGDPDSRRRPRGARRQEHRGTVSRPLRREPGQRPRPEPRDRRAARPSADRTHADRRRRRRPRPARLELRPKPHNRRVPSSTTRDRPDPEAFLSSPRATRSAGT